MCLAAMVLVAVATVTPVAGPPPAAAIGDVVPVSASVARAGSGCALMSDRTVRCWGSNDYGYLGDGTFTDRPGPVQVVGLSDVIEVQSGSSFACALLADGTVKCWGYNLYGYLGDGTRTERNTPVTVKNLGPVAALSVGYGYTCALELAGAVKCWGYNDFGQLGDGQQDNFRMLPATVPGLPADVTDVETSPGNGFATTCVTTASGPVLCWGFNVGVWPGGVPNTDGYNCLTCVLLSPTTVPDADSPAQLAVDWSALCVVATEGTVRCLGNGGILGDGVNATSHVFVTVPGVTGIVRIVVRTDHVCAVNAANQVTCWGSNSFGQLGDGQTRGGTEPVRAALLAPASPSALWSVDLGTCVLAADHVIRCVGLNFGTTPVQAAPLTRPDTPAAPTAAAGVGWAAVTVPPATSGATPATYRVTGSPGGGTCTVTLASSSSPPYACTVTGLTNGTPYTFTVVASNAAGDSSPSPPSAPVTLGTPGDADTEPTGLGTPQRFRVQSGRANATASWLPGSGWVPVNSYTVTADPGGRTCTVRGSARTCTVPGLVYGQTCTFTLIATSAIGSTTPVTKTATVYFLRPTKPRAVTGRWKARTCRFSWDPPGGTGGKPVTRYQYRVSYGVGMWSKWVSTAKTRTPAYRDGTRMRPYRIKVRAVNVVGHGPTSNFAFSG